MSREINNKGFIHIFLFLILLLAVGIILTLTVPKPDSAKAIASFDYSGIRGVTYLENRGLGKVYWDPDKLIRDIPAIKAAGFNTVWLVQPWSAYDPHPMVSPRVYNDEAFGDLTKSLDALKANNMKAILPLNYRMKAEGITPRWIYRDDQYAAFETYVTEYLTRIQNYSDMVYPMVFTEGTEGNDYAGAYRDVDIYAAQLRKTLGSLPTRLPPDLRAKFKIGYHDYSLIKLDWGKGVPYDPKFEPGQYPIQQPISFDFVSTTTYNIEDKTDDQIRAEMDLYVSRFKALYPNTPLIFGESGARSCINNTPDETTQSRVLTTQIKYDLEKHYGFNIWNWSSIPYTDNCGTDLQASDEGLALQKADLTPKPVLGEIKKLITLDFLGGNITTGSTVTAGQLFKFTCDWGKVINSNNPDPDPRLVDYSYNNGGGCTFDGFNGTAAQFTCKASSTAGGPYPVACVLGTVTPEYYNRQKVVIGDLTVTAVPSPSPSPSLGDGLTGQYFDNSNLTTLKLTRIDPTVNFNWSSRSPVANMGVDTYSIRWTGKVQPVSSGEYTFYTLTDDGVRLWINNVQIINKWQNQGATEWSGKIRLAAGTKYDIKMEYFENIGNARAELRWSGPSVIKQIIPKSQLYSK